MKVNDGKKITMLTAGLFFAMTAFGQNLQQAIQYTKNEQFEKADIAFKSLISSRPNEGEYYFYKGENFFAWGDMDSAKAAYQKGIQMNPANALNYAGLGKVQWYEGDSKDAQDNFFKAKTISKSKDALVLSKIAEAYINAPAKDLNTAVDLLNQAILRNSMDPDLYVDMGDAQWALNPTNASAAIEQYEKALSIDPKDVIAILREGMIYQRAANYDLSYQYYQKANQVDSTFAPAYREKAEMLSAAGRYDEAIAQYKKYLSLNDALSARVRYAEFLFLAKKYDESIAETQKVLARDSSNVILYRILAYAQYERKDYKNGLVSISKFFVKVPKTDIKILSSDYTYYGNLLFKNNQDSLAVQKLDEAATMMVKAKNPEDAARLYVQIGTTEYQNGKCALAVQYFQKCVQLNQADVNTYYYMGRSAYDCKKYQAADSAFAMVVNQRPDLLIGYLWRAFSNEAIDSLNETGQAQPFFDQYLKKVGADTVKNKDGYVAARSYSALCAMAKNDAETAKRYWNMVLAVDSNNATAKEALESLKRPKQQRQPANKGGKK